MLCYDGFMKLSSKVISTRSLLNEWAFCAHAHRISTFINKGESHDKNVAKSIRGKQDLFCIYMLEIDYFFVINIVLILPPLFTVFTFVYYFENI